MYNGLYGCVQKIVIITLVLKHIRKNKELETIIKPA